MTKKTEEVEDKKETVIEKFMKKFLKKKYKESSFITASEIVDDVIEKVSVGPKLDLALNGGIPEGSRVLIAGKVENDLQYPGMIKVNVIRETRAEEMAK